MIPRTIHYVWMGGAPKPPIVLHCIESWRSMCPDWELREWNDSAMGDIGNRYVQEAYSHRKWAFVADWMRLNALFRHGGFYLDTDMELLKPIDRFLENDLTMGLVDRHGKVLFNGCLIARLRDKGIMAVFHYLSLHKSKFYEKRHDGRRLPNADRYSDCLVRLPMYYDLDVGRVVAAIEEIFA